MNIIDIKTNEAAIFSLYLNTRLMYGDKRYIEIIFLTVYVSGTVREAFKKKTAYFVTLDQKVGGYLFQNIISFT